MTQDLLGGVRRQDEREDRYALRRLSRSQQTQARNVRELPQGVLSKVCLMTLDRAPIPTHQIVCSGPNAHSTRHIGCAGAEPGGGVLEYLRGEIDLVCHVRPGLVW